MSDNVFPTNREGVFNSDGLSLRDFFAAVALHAWMSSYGEDIPHPCADDCGQSCAALAYEMADHMLAARLPPPEPPQEEGK